MPHNPLLDTENYEEPRRAPKSEKRQRGAVVSVRFTPDELAALEARAQSAGMAVSTFLRSSALRPLAVQPSAGGSTISGSSGSDNQTLGFGRNTTRPVAIG
jgi:hypothetical protein